MYGLSIHIQSFRLDNKIVSKNDKIRVSITTIPDECKEAFIIDAKKMNFVHHFFTVNITDQTKKIIFVFRKKIFINNDPIIASTIVHSSDFPKLNDTANTEIKTINIYEPINGERFKHTYQDRRIFGQMQIQLSLADAYPTASFHTNFNIKKIHNGEGYSKIGMTSNENENPSNSLFVDSGY